MSTISAPQVIEFPGCATVVVHSPRQRTADLSAFMDRSFTALGRAIADGVFLPTGPAFSRHDGDLSGGLGEVTDVRVGFPVDTPLVEARTTDVDGVAVTLEPSELPACRLAITTHHGGYDGLGAAWGSFTAAVRARDLTPRSPIWEVYDTEPTPDMDPADLRTGLAMPVE